MAVLRLIAVGSRAASASCAICLPSEKKSPFTGTMTAWTPLLAESTESGSKFAGGSDLLGEHRHPAGVRGDVDALSIKEKIWDAGIFPRSPRLPFRSQPLEIIRSTVIGLVLLPERNRGDQLLSYFQEMSNKAQSVAGIFIAPLLMLAGLWLCLDGLEHGGLSGIFAIGPFVAVAGALWFVSDWFE